MKNSCKKIMPLLSEYVDGTLPGDVAWTVQLHVTACERCSLLVSRLQQTVAALRAIARPTISTSFDAALAARIADVAAVKRKAETGSIFDKAGYGLRSWVNAMSRRQRLRLAISTPVLAATLAVMLGLLLPHTTSEITPASNDAAFAATCIQQHRTFVASQPLADPSAQALAQHIDSTPNAGQGINALNVDGSL